MNDLTTEMERLNDVSLKILQLVTQMKQIMINRALLEGFTLEEIETRLKKVENA